MIRAGLVALACAAALFASACGGHHHHDGQPQRSQTFRWGGHTWTGSDLRPFRRHLARHGAGYGLWASRHVDAAALLGDLTAPPFAPGPARSTAVALTANVWASKFGSDSGAACSWHSTPTTAPSPAAACLTLGKACSLAGSGPGVVRILAGIMAGQSITRANCAPTARVLFVGAGEPATTCAADATATCIGSGSGGTAGVYSLQGGIDATHTNAGVAPDYLIFENLGVNGGVAMWTQSTSGGITNTVHHIGLAYVHVWDTGTTNAGGAGINPLVGLGDTASNVVVTNSLIGPYCCDEDAFVIGSQGGVAFPTDWRIALSTLRDGYQTCDDMPAARKAAYGCTGQGFGDNCGSDCTNAHHVDGIQTYDSTRLVVTQTAFYRAGCQEFFTQPAVGDGSQVTQSLTVTDDYFFEDATTCNGSVKGLVIGGPCGWGTGPGFTLTSGSPTVTTSDTTGLTAGQYVQGTGIPATTTVLSVDSSTQFTLSKNATASGSKTLAFTAACYSGTTQIAYNTSSYVGISIGSSNGSANGCQLWALGSTITLTGNLGGYDFVSGATCATHGDGACTTNYVDGTTLTPAFSKNVPPTATTTPCGSDVSHDPTFASLTVAAPNLDLAPTSQTGITHAAENVKCGPGKLVAVDIHGTARPATPCTVGGDEP